MPGIALFLLLCAFWASLSGQLDNAFLVGVGLVSSALIVLALSRLDLILTSWSPGRLLWGVVSYGPWLAWQVVVSNVKVIRVIWSPSLRIAPRMIRVPVSLSTPLGRVAYANSITLTPGTVTITTDEEEFLVHALTPEDAAGVLSGEMHGRLQRLEPTS